MIVYITSSHFQSLLPSADPATSNSDPHSSLKSLTDFFISLTQPTLLVLHQFNSVPTDIGHLHSLMNNPHVSTIMMSPISINSNSFINTIHKVLVRGCTEHEVMPLDFSQSMQRLVYFILSQHELHPMNREQEVLESIQELMCGNAAIAKLCLAVLEKFIQQEDGVVSRGLETFSNEVISPTLTHQQKLGGVQETAVGAIGLDGDESTATAHKTDSTLEHEEGTSTSTLEGKGSVLGTVSLDSGDSTNTATPLEDSVCVDSDTLPGEPSESTSVAQVSTASQHTKSERDVLQPLPDPLMLIFAGQLLSCMPCSAQTRVLMQCLSTLKGAPFHGLVLNKLSSAITKYSCISSDKDLALVLKSYHVIVPYPFPVVQAPVAMDTDVAIPSYYIMPESITEAVYLSLSDEDKAALCGIIDRTLDEMSSSRVGAEHESNQRLNGGHSLSMHVEGLKTMLLKYSTDDQNAFNGPVNEGVIQQYIEKKMKTREYGVSQLIQQYFKANHIST